MSKETDNRNTTITTSNLINDYFTSYYQRISKEVDNDIENFIVRVVQTEVDNNHNTVDNITYKVNAKMIYKAIRKSIKRKPFIQGADPSNYHFFEHVSCPTCFVRFNLSLCHPNYCPECGQALDWSKNE